VKRIAAGVNVEFAISGTKGARWGKGGKQSGKFIPSRLAGQWHSMRIITPGGNKNQLGLRFNYAYIKMQFDHENGRFG